MNKIMSFTAFYFIHVFGDLSSKLFEVKYASGSVVVRNLPKSSQIVSPLGSLEDPRPVSSEP